MKSIKLLHNPGAGEAEHSKKDLLALIESEGFQCSYSSTKEAGWEELIPNEIDFVVIAGGDGTVRKLAKHLLNRKLVDKKFPIGLIPLGTANNIARTLNLAKTPEEIIKTWKHENLRNFDIGRIYGIKQVKFIMEGLGFGVFPKLMKMMKARETQSGNPEEEIRTALQFLHEIVLNYRAKPCTIRIDGVERQDEYLLVEIMNTKSIGPNLNLTPSSDPGDGKFEVMLIPKEQRQLLAEYVIHRMENGKEERFAHQVISAKKIELTWEGCLLHADDELIPIKKSQPITIEIGEHTLQFLV